MGNDTELTEAGRQYAAAYPAHYTDHELVKLFKACDVVCMPTCGAAFLGLHSEGMT